jgi:DNA-binding transcriptional regulator YiaG
MAHVEALDLSLVSFARFIMSTPLSRLVRRAHWHAMSNAIAGRLAAIQAKGAMRLSDVANALTVRPETVSRWNTGRSLPQASADKQLLE